MTQDFDPGWGISMKKLTTPSLDNGNLYGLRRFTQQVVEAKLQGQTEKVGVESVAIKSETDLTLGSLLQILDTIKIRREERKGRTDCD